MYFHIDSLEEGTAVSGKLLLFQRDDEYSKKRLTNCYRVMLTDIEFNKPLFKQWNGGWKKNIGERFILNPTIFHKQNPNKGIPCFEFIICIREYTAGFNWIMSITKNRTHIVVCKSYV